MNITESASITGPAPTFTISSHGAQARAIPQWQGRSFTGLTVLAGSRIRPDLVPSYQDTGTVKRQELLKAGILKQIEESLTFAQDHTFSSASAASNIVMGRNSNGLTEWRAEETHQTLADWAQGVGIRLSRSQNDADASASPLPEPVLPAHNHVPGEYLTSEDMSPEELKTLHYAIKYGGEGEDSGILRTFSGGQARYWQLRHHDTFDDDDDFAMPYRSGPSSLIFLSSDAAEALQECPHPWYELVGLEVAADLRELVDSILRQHGKSLQFWLYKFQ